MKLPIRVFNVCGGALFAYSSLLFLQSIVVAQGNVVQAGVNNAALMVSGSKSGGLGSSDRAWGQATSNELLDNAARVQSTQNILLALATVGAGLACLREKA